MHGRPSPPGTIGSFETSSNCICTCWRRSTPRREFLQTWPVGAPAAVRDLLAGAGLAPEVAEVEVDLPWPGAAAFVDYRLATVGVAGLVDDPATVRREAIAAVAALPPETLPWTPRLVLGTGGRQGG